MKHRAKYLVAMCVALASAGAFAPRAVAAPLASDQVRILGIRLEVSPGSLDAPRNVLVLIDTALKDGAGNDVSSSPIFTNWKVRGELSGPGLDGVVALEGRAGAKLEVPPLLLVGNYIIDGLRLVDGAGSTVLAATPSLVRIRVVEKIIVSQVTSRPLSIDEIRDKGIIIDESNFTAIQFTFGFTTESGVVPIDFDVAFPQDDELEEEGGGLSFPPILPGIDTPNLDIQGIILERPPDFDDVEIPPIPGILVIPGNIAFLNQFFQVMLLVSNVAPAGSQLVVTSATAELLLPFGPDGAPETTDDPLAPARTAAFPEGTLATEVRNAATGGPEFGPGEDANGEFLVEGRTVGTHRLKVTIEAELRLATGQIVPLSGTVFGTVVVRNPSFTLTLNHPDVVRAGETYTLAVTITNISETPANLVRLTLDPTLISGATLVGHSNGDPLLPFGTAEVDQIRAGDATTVNYQLIARQSGRVTAAAFQAEAGAAGAFLLRTGIGDRGIPLSPSCRPTRTISPATS
jgi:hypothetical protein